MQIEQRKYYVRGLLLPCVLVLLVHLGDYIIHESQATPSRQSEYFTEDALNGIGFLLVVANTIFVLLLSSPILLFDLAAKTKIVRFLCWFLLPGSWLLYLIWNGVWSLNDSFYVLSNSIPYMAGLTWSYIAFNKHLNIVNGALPDLEVITKEDRKIEQPHTPPPQSPMS